MKINYLTLFDEIISSADKKNPPRLLLHACCAPCLSSSLELLTQFFQVDVFFYNPNILPADEFNKRESEVRRLLRVADFAKNSKLISPENTPEVFTEAAKGFENAPEGGVRCERCFRLRIRKTAETAAVGGYDFFGTTLTISPHKNAEIINGICEDAAKEFGVRALPLDLKKRDGYKRSIELSREFELYRQNYCGCQMTAGGAGSAARIVHTNFS
jgi:predicted adenine nucleotide alpha hydrolase (AANH) superfamily ATPase